MTNETIPPLRQLLALTLLGCSACSGGGDGTADDEATMSETVVDVFVHNTLSSDEAADGWTLLFDGQTIDQWRGYGRDDMPETWIAENGEMMLQASSGNMDGGDIITVAEYTNFELTFDFKVGPSGNSGVFYRAVETDGKGLWQVSAEYQVLDDPAYPESDDWDPRTHRTGENYDLEAADNRIVHPIGEWNSGRIVARGNTVQHWLNGTMTVEYELYSEKWNGQVEASKFSDEEHYARAASGSFGLQDHGTPVWYRNMKIRTME